MSGLGEWGEGSGKEYFFFTKNPIFSLGGGGGGCVFFYKLTGNPNLTKIFFFVGGRGVWEGKCTCMNKCFRWQFYSLRRTPVQNYFEIHAYM